MRNKIIAGGLALLLTVSGYFAHEAIGDTRFGAFLHALTTLTLPFQSTDNILVERGSVSLRTPATSVLQTANNLSDVPSKTNSRWNLGNGSPSQNVGAVSLMDFGADPTGVASSDAAFVSCSTSGHNCYIPPGTYQIACTTHNVTNGTILYGDDAKAATLKLPAGCAFPTTGLINLANIENITIDLNTPAVPGSPVRVVSNFIPSSTVNLTPFYQGMQILNGTTNMYLIQIGAQNTGNVLNPIVRNNNLAIVAPASTSANECILATNGTSTVVVGGQITGNVCVNAGINGSIQDAYITNNDVSGWAYSAGIMIAQTSVSFNNHILNNRLYNSGTALDIETPASPTNGIVNWGRNSEIAGNIIRNVGGACIDNGGQNSTITGNYCLDAENRVDTFGDAAYFTFFQDTTFNGNGSSWIGNYATDDRGAGAKVLVGYQDSTSNTNVFLSGNAFPGIPTPYLTQ